MTSQELLNKPVNKATEKILNKIIEEHHLKQAQDFCKTGEMDMSDEQHITFLGKVAYLIGETISFHRKTKLGKDSMQDIFNMVKSVD